MKIHFPFQRNSVTRRTLMACVTSAACCCTLVAAPVTEDLSVRLHTAGPREFVPVLVYFTPPSTPLPLRLSKDDNRSAMETLLAPVSTHEARSVRSLWVCHAVALEATPAAIRRMARCPGVCLITEDAWHMRESVPPDPESEDEAWNLERIGAARLWAEGMNGTGIRIGIIDTGIDASHPDLSGRLLDAGWFDAVNQRVIPYDDNGHGTHVAGVVSGGQTTGITIGAAPGSRLLVAKALDFANGFRTSWVIDAGQWMLDPNGDGNPADAPHIVNASWTFNDPLRQDFRPVLEAWRSAGIWPVFAAGNGGPGEETVSAPANDPLVLAVGATDQGDSLAISSARGPAPLMAPWNGVLKPDICAPGVMIYSAARAGKYAILSGTSTAAPHVAGALALLRQARPDLPFEEARRILRWSAIDLGTPGPDIAFGEGRIDIYRAVHFGPNETPPGLSGWVRTGDGSPVRDAVVNVAGTFVLSDLQGFFRIPHVADALHAARADAPGYAPAATQAVTGVPASIPIFPRTESILVNGDLENEDAWEAGGASGGLVRSFLINRTPGGRWSLGVYAVGDGEERYWISPRVTLPPGVWTRVNAGYAWRGLGSVDGTISALIWEDASGAPLATSYGTRYSPPTRGGIGDGVWRMTAQANEVAPPPGAVSVRLRLGGSFPLNDRSSSLHFDDAFIDVVAPGGPGALGDLDKDGAVTMADAIMALKSAGGMTLTDPSAVVSGDLGPSGPSDGRITLLDAAVILRLVTGLHTPPMEKKPERNE